MKTVNFYELKSLKQKNIFLWKTLNKCELDIGKNETSDFENLND